MFCLSFMFLRSFIEELSPKKENRKRECYLSFGYYCVLQNEKQGKNKRDYFP